MPYGRAMRPSAPRSVMPYVCFCVICPSAHLAERWKSASHLSVLFNVLTVRVTPGARRRTLSRQTP